MAKHDFEQIYWQAVRIANSQERLRFLRKIFQDDPDRVRETGEMSIWIMANKLDRETPERIN